MNAWRDGKRKKLLNSSGGAWLKTTFRNCELLKNFQLPFITLKRVKGITACKFITETCQGIEDES